MNTGKEKLLSEIYRFGKKQRLFKLYRGLVLFLSILTILWLSLSLADDYLYFSEVTRWGLWFIHFFFILFLFNKFIIQPFKEWYAIKQESDLSPVCNSINAYFPEIQHSLSNAYNLITKNQQQEISKDLLDIAVSKYLSKFTAYVFKDRLKLKQYLPSFNFILPVFLSAAILLSFKTENILHSTKRLLNPSNEYLNVPEYKFHIQPGNTRIIKGSDLNLKVQYSGPALGECHLIISQQNETDGRIIPLKQESGLYITSITDIQKPFSYRVTGRPLQDKSLKDHIISNTYMVDVLIPPLVKNLDVSLLPPVYTGMDKEYLARNVGDINALPGTKVQVKATVNKILNYAVLEFSDGNKINCNIQGERISADFNVNQNTNYKILLEDTSGLQNQNPIEYTIAVQPDNLPYVEINQPGDDVEMQLDATLLIQAVAMDDFGISSSSILYKFLHSSKTASDTAWHRHALPVSGTGKRQDLKYLWDFNKLPVTFNDGIVYYIEARDNNTVSGPGIGVSKRYYIRFPSLEELFDDFNENENEQIDKVEDITKRSDELKKNLEKINRDLKRAEEIEWEQKQQIENSLEKQKEIQKEIQEVHKELEEMINKMEANDLISEELLEKYSKLQELFKEIATPELMDAMNKLQNSLDKADPKQVQKALEQFKLNQEEFQKRIERTMELLKQVQLEQKMDQLVQKATRLMEQQKKISEQLKDENALKKENASQLAEQQKQQEALLENLKKDTDDLLHEPRLSKFQASQEQLKNALEIGEKIQERNQMKDIQNSMTQQQRAAAMNMSSNLQNQITQMQASISDAQSKMLNQNKQDLQNKMRSATRKLLQLSYDQEQILNSTNTTSPLDDDFADISVRQGHTQQNFQKVISELIQLSKETFFINPGMSKILGESQTNMIKSIDELSERNKSQAARYQSQAMQALNESVMQMQQSMSQMSQSQSATGFEQFMEQMQQMAGNQGQLNEQTLNLFQGQGNQGSMTMRQQQQMQRLAGEQAALRDALQKMSEKMGSRRDMLGRIGELGQKMDEVVQDLIKQNVNRETIERQRQILSRMLDAQKSVREREYSKKRKAEIAKDYKVIDPGELKNLTDLQKKRLQDALKKSMNDGYKTDYQNLIELYFKNLIRQQNEKN
ncbi:MAG: hypothetical protein P8X42_04800 [Calditrichaceae bacterium]